MLGVGPMQAFIAVTFTIPTFTFNDCSNEALMNEFDNSWLQTTTKILWVLGNTFMVAFILYPMIIPGSISVIGLDMIWDPETDSQSLSMSGFSSILQPSRPNKTKKSRPNKSNQINIILYWIPCFYFCQDIVLFFSCFVPKSTYSEQVCRLLMRTLLCILSGFSTDFLTF